MGHTRPLLFIIVLFELKKHVDGVLGILTRGRKIEGADDTKVLWRPP